MLKYEVDMGDKEMQQAECCVLEEFPPTPEPKEHIMHATTTQEHEVIDISSKRKDIMDVSSHAVAQQSCTDHEQNDPPIEPDQPPPDDKIPHHAEEETDEQNINTKDICHDKSTQLPPTVGPAHGGVEFLKGSL